LPSAQTPKHKHVFFLALSTLVAYIIVAALASAVGVIIAGRMFHAFSVVSKSSGPEPRVSVICFHIGKSVSLGSAACPQILGAPNATVDPSEVYFCVVYASANASVSIVTAGGEYSARAGGVCAVAVQGRPLFAVLRTASGSRAVEVKLR